MRRRSALFYTASAIAASAVIAGGAATARAASAQPARPSAVVVSGWGSARTVPAPKGEAVSFGALSCAGPGDCAAGGAFEYDGGSKSQGLFMQEQNGRWGAPAAVPGLAALNSGDSASVTSLSCSSPGYCSAAGAYRAGPDASVEQPFVVTEKNGRWGAATEVPGITSLNAGGYAAIGAGGLSCASAGNCSAIGFYRSAQSLSQEFVVNEVGGVWGSAANLPGVATASTESFRDGGQSGGFVSCTAPGDCTAAGAYTAAPNTFLSYRATETNGRWSAAAGIAGTGPAYVTALSCASPGNCAAGGTLTTADAGGQSGGGAFVVTQVKGVWGAARAVPGIGRLEGKGGESDLLAVSCASAGDCTAVGGYQPARVGEQEFAVTEHGGAWGNAERLPGIPWFKNGSGGPGVAADAVSCPSAGDCSAGGSYPLTSSGDTTAAFVDDETNGHWHTVRRVAGPPAGYTGVFAASSLSALSCATPSYCAAVGRVGTPVGAENFLADKAPLEATRSTLKLSAGKVTYGHEQTERLTVKVTPAHAGTPAGTVTVKAGKATVCVITLTAGKGGCTLAPKKLPAGTYRLVGTYGGNPYYLGSASARQTLTVTR